MTLGGLSVGNAIATSSTTAVSATNCCDDCISCVATTSSSALPTRKEIQSVKKLVYMMSLSKLQDHQIQVSLTSKDNKRKDIQTFMNSRNMKFSRPHSWRCSGDLPSIENIVLAEGCTTKRTALQSTSDFRHPAQKLRVRHEVVCFILVLTQHRTQTT